LRLQHRFSPTTIPLKRFRQFVMVLLALIAIEMIGMG
jgi:hypothetical protein